MKVARRATIIAALIAASLSPALAAPHHRTGDRAYGHVPRITIYPARRELRPYIDFSRYIDPISGMYCHNTGWATTCVPPRAGAPYTQWQPVDCRLAWPFPVCTRF
ncbi:MAG TPA: hypothetical protein VMA30_06405 [Xanthobacteraceae bacterium]|nr:hypothetical protein [Xanthobacteraceae bacterium]